MFPWFRFQPGLCLALLGCCLALSAGAEAPAVLEKPALSLAEAIARTRAVNPDLAVFAFRLRAEAARGDAAARTPQLELHGQLENVLGTGVSRGFSGAEVTLSLSRLIELGGQREHRMELAGERRSTLELEREITQLDVLAELGRRYIHVAADERQKVLTALATQLARNTLAEVQRRVEAARSPEVELHRARIRLARAELEEEHAEHELLTSRRKLSAMWGAREPDFGPVSAQLLTLPELGDEAGLQARLTRSPDFLRYASEARQREAELRLAEAKGRTALTLSGGLRRLQATQDTAFVAGFSLPLFASRQTASERAEASALREVAIAEGQAAQVRAEASLFELIQELRHVITEATMLRDQSLPQMEAALKATEYAWQRGRYSTLEWTEAQQERIAIERALIEAAANAHRFRIEIERLTGAAVTP